MVLLSGAWSWHHSAAAIAKPSPTPIVPNVPARMEKVVLWMSFQNYFIWVTNSKLILMSYRCSFPSSLGPPFQPKSDCCQNKYQITASLIGD
jgi:hypothetical protein